ncbi:tetratricopeptide repeat protein, partial [Enterobacter cloacae]|uniref:tetratricopeptide repeat protein n=2 Tax=Pseudomonadota TaxID=1224 RepID=UPI0013D1ADA5
TWYEAAARQGHTTAQYNLAVMLGRGQGREADPAKAAEWFEAAARQGMVEAELAIGDALRAGNGVAQDRDQALHWYRQAARQNNEGALRRLQ